MVHCRDCKFWEPINGYKGGCRRRAPVWVDDAIGPGAPWQETMAGDWCGESSPTVTEGNAWRVVTD